MKSVVQNPGSGSGPNLLVTNCGELITVAGPDQGRTGKAMRDIGLIRNTTLWIKDGRFERWGAWPEIKALAGSESVVIDAEGKVVLPGFVDAHTHFVFGGQRSDEFERRALGESYQSIAASGGGIRSTVRQTRAASPDELQQAARRRLRWALRNGTTAVEIKSGYGLSLESEINILEVIRQLQNPQRVVPTFLGAHEVPDEFRGRPSEYIDLLIEEVIPVVVRNQLAEYADVFCEPHIFDLALSERYLRAAFAHGLRGRMHVDQLSCSGGAELAAGLRVVTADHLEQTSSSGIKALRDAGVQPVLLPGSVYALGLAKYADARAMIEAGLAVVLATDCNPGSSPVASIPMIMSLAVTQMKMSVAEAITATTINAAASLDRAHLIGSIAPGKLADFAIHDCDDYRELGYFFGRDTALKVFVEGTQVYER